MNEYFKFELMKKIEKTSILQVLHFHKTRLDGLIVAQSKLHKTSKENESLNEDIRKHEIAIDKILEVVHLFENYVK